MRGAAQRGGSPAAQRGAARRLALLLVAQAAGLLPSRGTSRAVECLVKATSPVKGRRRGGTGYSRWELARREASQARGESRAACPQGGGWSAQAAGRRRGQCRRRRRGGPPRTRALHEAAHGAGVVDIGVARAAVALRSREVELWKRILNGGNEGGWSVQGVAWAARRLAPRRVEGSSWVLRRRGHRGWAVDAGAAAALLATARGRE